MKSIKKRLAAAVLTVTVAASLAACGGKSEVVTPMKKAKPVNTISFKGVKAPETEDEKKAVLASESVTINGETYPIGFHTIIRSGDKPSPDSDPFGLIFDKNGKPVLNKDGSNYLSDNSDFASLLKGKDGKIYMVSHFENSPGAMYVTKLNQDANGILTAEKTRNIDFKNIEGGWVHCAGSVTPWGTHLGSEEYEPDAKLVDAKSGKITSDYDNDMAKYYGLVNDSTQEGYYNGMNVYNYGWQIEIGVKDYNNVDVAKHYSMGRVAHELAYVMPDKKTAYISDDGTNVGLFRYVADKAGDLTSGELFAAKWTQTSTDNAGAANISWVSLGKATDAEIKSVLDKKVGFNDIFETFDLKKGACPADFKSINTTRGEECLKVKKGMEKAASRLETRRYAALLGATTEFRKMEGITFDPDTMTMYLAMSEVAAGMGRGTKDDKGGPDHIQLPVNKCGAVYALSLDANYAATKISGVVAGVPVVKSYGAADDSKAYPKDSPFAKNKCSLEGISNPDNVTFMPGYKTLIIGEDTGDGHQNDMIWSFNIETKALTRIQTTPYGSETTSPYFYPNFHGYGYIMSVIQHPYGESDEDKAAPGSEQRRAYTGFVGPFPAMD